MDADARVVEVKLESSVKSVELAEEISRNVCKTAGFNPEAAFQIELAVHETVVNAVFHGNKENPSKSVFLKFLIREDGIEIHVRDEGTGFDPSSLPDPLAKENLLNIHGRGIFIVRQFMDEFRVASSAGSGTEVTMIKYRDPRTDAEHGRRQS